MGWYYVAFVVASVIISIALAPKPAGEKPPSLDELDIPTAEEGLPIPIVFGTVVVQSPNVVWYGDLGYVAIRTKSGK